MIELSHTKLGYLRGCSMKYKFRYEDGLIPIRQSSEMTIGKVVHEAFDMMYKGKQDQEAEAFIKDTYQTLIGSQEVVDVEDYTTAGWIAWSMYKFYPYKDLSRFDIIKSEIPFRIRLRRGVYVVGIIDRLLKANGVFWIGEMKTTGLTQRQFEQRTQTSMQKKIYTWAAKKLGYNVGGMIYDCIKRPLLRKRREEDMDLYGRRIYADYADPKRKEHYYKQHYAYVNPQELELFENELNKMADEYKWRLKHNAWIRDTDECWNWNRECPYMKICGTLSPDPLTLQLFYTKGEDHDKAKGNKKQRRPLIGSSNGSSKTCKDVT